MLRYFTQKNKINKKNIVTNNPIWNIARSSSYLFQEIKTVQRQAVLINIDFPPKHKLALDQGYDFQSRHLAIDKKYNKTNQQHGLCLAHYTEEYTNKIDSSSIKIHVYLDKHAKCKYIQAKKYYASGDNEIIKLNYEAAAIENSQDATNILNEFLTIRMNNYLEAVQQSNKLEKKLSDALIELLKGNIDLDSYTLKANEFIRIIKTINSYVDDYIDMRGKFVKSLLENLRIKMQAPADEMDKHFSEEESENEDHDHEIDIIFIPSRHQINDSGWHEEQKKQLIENLTAKYEQFNSVQDLLQKQNFLQDIKFFLLTLTFNENLMQRLSKKEQALVAEIEAQAYAEHNNSDRLFEIFMEQCFNGNIVEVEKLFEHVQYKIDFIFVYNLIKAALSAKANSETSLNIIKVMDFIYENSSIYRVILPWLGEIVCGMTIELKDRAYGNITNFSKLKEIQTSNIQLKFEKIYISICKKFKKVLFLPLFKAIYTNNIPLLKALLRHEMPASSCGIIIFEDNRNASAYSTLNASLLFHCNIEFIKILHENNPFLFCDIPYEIIINNKLMQHKLTTSMTEIIFKEHCYKCPLILFLDNDNKLTEEAIEFFQNNFMDRINFRDLILVFAFLANISYSNTTLTFRSRLDAEYSQEKILLCENKEDIIGLLSNQEQPFKNIRFAYHTSKERNTCNMVNILYRKLMAIIDQQSIEEQLNTVLCTELLCTELNLTDSTTEKLCDFRHANLNAGLLLLSFKDQLTHSDVTKIVKLFMNISSLYANRDPEKSARAKQKATLVLRTIKVEEPTKAMLKKLTIA